MKFTFKGLALACAAACVFALLPLNSNLARNHVSTPDVHGIALANMDRSVRPGDDFYHYANGDWI